MEERPSEIIQPDRDEGCATEFCNIDEVFRIEGPFAKFQLLIQLASIYLSLTVCWNFVMSVFTGDSPGWRCHNQNSSNFCRENFNKSFTVIDAHFYHRCQLRRSEWTFTVPADYSFVTEFELVCDKAWLAALVSASYYIGGFVGSLLSGNMADTFGRKPALLASIVTTICFSVAGSYVTSIWQLFVVNFFIGGASVGCYFTVFVYLVEFVPPSYRALAGTILQISLTMSYMLIALLAYYEKAWRTLKFHSSLPIIPILIIFFFFIPESPRWLLSRRKVTEAEIILAKVLDFNGHSASIPKLKCADEIKGPSYNYTHLFRGFNAFRLSSSIALVWFALAVLGYTLILGSPTLGGDIYQAYVLTNTPGILSCIISPYFANRIGRKKTILGSLAISSIFVGCMALVPINVSYRYFVNLGLMMLAQVFCILAFCTVYTWTFEIFPTVLRSQGVSVCILCERVGITLAPFITRLLLRVSRVLPFIIICVLAFVTSLIGLKLPETNKKATREDYKDFFENKSLDSISHHGKDNSAANIADEESVS